MNPSEVNKLIYPIIYNNYDFVQGSRFLDYQKNNNTPKFRKASIPILSKIVSIIFNQKLTDVTCGFRAIKVSLLKRANFEFSKSWLYGYAFEPYLYSNVFLDKKVKKIEVPVEMKYPELAGVKYTKIKPIINYPALVIHI